ncbi:MAG: hypothetical protein LBD75_02795 [Candidatus Peribacteria bacterium]|nr:hypothetical protein [Candidatus Peribacteria bacterium]
MKFAYQHTSAGKVCLLSTASPSYSIWKNFEEKGKLFQKWVTHFQAEYTKGDLEKSLKTYK